MRIEGTADEAVCDERLGVCDEERTCDGEAEEKGAFAGDGEEEEEDWTAEMMYAVGEIGGWDVNEEGLEEEEDDDEADAEAEEEEDEADEGEATGLLRMGVVGG